MVEVTLGACSLGYFLLHVERGLRLEREDDMQELGVGWDRCSSVVGCVDGSGRGPDVRTAGKRLVVWLVRATSCGDSVDGPLVGATE